jgi:hypothetical protein
MTKQEKKLREELRSLADRQPFLSFAIILRDGQRFELHRKRRVAFAEGNPRVIVVPDGATHSSFFNWSDIRSIEVLEPAT